MRETNAKTLGQTADKSTQTAKRAVLLAVLVASASTVSAQTLENAPIDARYGVPAQTPMTVRHNSKFADQQGIGNVKSNPFFSRTLRQPKRVTAEIAVPRTGNDLSAFIRQGETELTQSAASVQPMAPSASPAQLTITADLVQPLVPANRAGAKVETAPRFATPINVLGNEKSRVIPVADARDELQAIKETQPIFFTFSDDTPILESAPKNATAGPSQKTDTSAPDIVESGSPSLIKPKADPVPVNGNPAEGVIGETGGETNDQKERTALTTVDSPVKLAPVIDFSMLDAPAVAEPATISFTDSVAEPDASSTASSDAEPNSTPETTAIANPVSEAPKSAVVQQPVVRFNPSLAGPAGGTADTVGDDSSEVGQKVHVVFADNDVSPMPELNGARDEESISSQDAIVDSDREMAPILLAPKSKRTAIAVASLPVPIERIGVNGAVAKPTVDTVTHDPSTAPAFGNKGSVASVNSGKSARRTGFDPAAQRVPKSVLGNSSLVARSTPKLPPSAPPSVLKSEGTPAKLATSKQNLQTTSESPRRQRREPIVLNLSRAQVRSMMIGGELRGLKIGDKDICQAFQAGASQIKLIGTGLGKTELTIWADVAAGEPTRMQTFEIEVSDGVNATGDKVSERTALLNESIDQAFPRASVVVSRRGGELNVTGRCDTEAEAKQIIRMVRKSCLVPVQDNLKVRQL